MDSVAKSTPIQELPLSRDGNQSGGSEAENQVVQDILQEIQNTQQPNSVPNHPNDANNQHGLNRQMDPAVQPAQIMPQPTPEQIMEMSANKAPSLSYQNTQAPASKKSLLSSFGGFGKSFAFNLLEEMKKPLVVFILVFVSNQAFFNQLLLKVPTAVSTTGQITIVGNLVKAFGVAAIFMVLSKFLSR